MQKHVNVVDLVKSFPTNIFLQNLASIKKRTSPIKFAHLAEKPEQSSISNLSTKVNAGCCLPVLLFELLPVAGIFDDVAMRVEGNASQGSIACIGLRDLAPHFARRRVNEAKLLVSRDEIALRGHSGARSSQT